MALKIGRFDRLSLDELVEVRAKVEIAIENRVAAEKSALQAKLTELSALTNGSRRAPVQSRRRSIKKSGTAKTKVHPLKGRKAAPKYRGPGGETWSGRGLAPRWLVALEKKGRKRDSLLIKQ